jgi:chromosomal replication initiator protein
MHESPEKLWSRTQQKLKGLLNEEIYGMWFAPIRMVEFSNDTIVLGIPNNFFEDWLRDNYFGLLTDVVGQTLGKFVTIQFQVVAHEVRPEEVHASAGRHRAEGSSSAAGKIQENGHMSAHDGELSDDESSGDKPQHIPGGAGINAWDRSGAGSRRDGASSTSPGSGRRNAAPGSRDILPPSFNPHYTFENFVVGENNAHAHAAARAVAKTPGQSFNPLFLYGGVGLGKTHLLQAIGQEVYERGDRSRVAYVSCEMFTNEYISALQNNELPRFRKKYRLLDLLLIDDIQFLQGKERIQEEFFHTFNSLHECRKQIVLTSDCPPNELKGLEQRLISRFEWGLTVDVQPPDVETRLAILKNKARTYDRDVPEEIFLFLAERIKTNIRRLEGALVRLVSLASLTGKPLTITVAEKVLSEILQEEQRQVVSIKSIQKIVAEHFDIRLEDMKSRRRPENIAFPRQIAMFLCRELTDLSLSAIGEDFGGRDHGTVLHAYRLVKDRMEIDTKIRETINYLIKVINR